MKQRTTEEASRPLSRWPRGALFLWPIAVFTAIQQARDSLVTSTGGDFIPVWRAARAFVERSESYHVAAFVYPPSALLLFAPFGGLSFNQAHLVFHVLNTGSIILAAVLALRVFRIRLASATAAGIMFALFISAPVRLTLYTENVNGVVLAAQMVAFSAAISGRWTLAGMAFGLGLAVKPVLLPLLLFPLLARQWRGFVTAIAVPIVLSALVLPFMTDSAKYVTEIVPFLWKGNYPQNYAINTSISGAVRILDLSSWFAWVMRVLTLVAGAALIWFRLMAADDRTIIAAHLVGLALPMTFLVFSFSWPYYALYLLPVFVSFASPHSTLYGWRLMAAGAAAYLIASQDYFPRFGSVRITCGYFALLAALGPTPVGRSKVREE